jgi:hypothetical protein
VESENQNRKSSVEPKIIPKKVDKCANYPLLLPCKCLIAKMLEWRECDHEYDDSMALNDPRTIDYLRQCGLLKF